MNEIARKPARCISDVGKITVLEGEPEGRREVWKERTKNFRSRKHGVATFLKVCCCATLKKCWCDIFFNYKRNPTSWISYVSLVVVAVSCLKSWEIVIRARMRCDGRAQDVSVMRGKRAEIKRRVITRQGSPSVDSNYPLQGRGKTFSLEIHTLGEQLKLQAKRNCPDCFPVKQPLSIRYFFFYVSHLSHSSYPNCLGTLPPADRNAWQICRLK